MKQSRGPALSLSKGFTLIELLVVISIIGILSGVVLSSLSNARNKAKDGAIKSILSSTRLQGEIYYDINQNYGPSAGNCEVASSIFQTPREDGGLKEMIDQIKVHAGHYEGNPLVICKSELGTKRWAVFALLNSKVALWCSDSHGHSQEISPRALTIDACS